MILLEHSFLRKPNIFEDLALSVINYVTLTNSKGTGKIKCNVLLLIEKFCVNV